ncbi:MAG: biotin-dependent carboxyltransferase family protein [Chloroflexi bacterium]|nr:biotin-dependent carboxyltransferase family protein [Chloroflexota bacterium]
MLRILDSGLFTTIQDAGRWGYQAYGVPVSGAMDLPALSVANQLVRNSRDEAALEIHSPVALRTNAPHLIALTGADARFEINGRALPMGMSVFARAGATIEIAPKRAGGWIYLAIHGGIDVPRVLGSKSTFLRGKFGGLEGRALAAGDHIHIGAPTLDDLVAAAGRSVGVSSMRFSATDGDESPTTNIRVILGPHADWFTPEAIAALTRAEFIVAETADRMGYRLIAPSPLRRGVRGEVELISCGVPFGAIQVPPDGQPIVLMADHQTTGGYPIIAMVVSEDIARVAQSVPGDRLMFRAVTLEGKTIIRE